jgi:hypothetical protein
MDSTTPNLPIETVGTPTEKESKSAKRRLQALITEALEIERARTQDFSRRFPGVPQLWPAWPYWDFGPITSRVTKELGGQSKSVREIRWRLKQFEYPYPHSVARKPTTFYQHAKSMGLLGILLNPPLLFEIRSFWWLQRQSNCQRDVKTQKKSEYGYPLAFHRELVFQLAAHIGASERLAKKYEVSRTEETKSWSERFEEYRRAALKQLLNEAAIVYPEIQLRLTPATQLKEKAEKLKAEIALYDKLNSAIKRRGKESHKFAYHLTSLICTPRESILKHKLRPTPETVRVDIKKWMKKHPI